jgi:hypothetical protein
MKPDCVLIVGKQIDQLISKNGYTAGFKPGDWCARPNLVPKSSKNLSQNGFSELQESEMGQSDLQALQARSSASRTWSSRPSIVPDNFPLW